MPSSSPASPDTLARSFDRAALEYERGRPGWPVEAVDFSARELELGGSAVALDLGAGTGKLTRVLVGRFERVVAVEPLDGLRELLAAVVPGAEALAGSAEDIPLPDASVDTVFAGDAFHWFDGQRALREIARVLRPRAGLVLLWNRPAGPAVPALSERLRDEINRRYRAVEHPSQGYEAGEWRRAFAGSPFEELRDAQFDNPQRLDREGMVAFLSSLSWIVTLPDEEREHVVDLARELVSEDDYVKPWRTELFWTRLRT